MKFETAMMVKNRMVSNLMSAFKQIESEQCTIGKALKYREDALLFLPKDTPEWLRQYLNGFCDHWRMSAMMYKMEYMYRYEDRLYGIDSSKDNYYEKHGITPMELNMSYTESGYFWKGTNKPFSVSKKGEDDGQKP